VIKEVSWETDGNNLLCYWRESFRCEVFQISGMEVQGLKWTTFTGSARKGFLETLIRIMERCELIPPT